MRSLPILLIVLCQCFVVSSVAQDLTNPKAYNDFIVSQQEKIIRLNINYVMESVHNDNVQAVEKKRMTLIKELGNNIQQLEKLPPFEDDAVLKKEAIAVFTHYLNAFKIEFKEANLLKAKRMESYEAMEEYFMAQNRAEKKLEEASSRLIVAQTDFAKKHNMRIIENESKNEKDIIEVINEVNAYSRKVFLIYFKVSKDDASILNAMTEKNPTKMDSYRKKLLISADEGLIKLKALGPYKKDDELRKSVVELLEFHKKMGKGGYADMVSFLKKANNKLTQQDVDTYNAVIKILNSEPPLLITKFNEANAAFLKKHIPGGGTRI